MATLWDVTIFSVRGNSWKASGLRTGREPMRQSDINLRIGTQHTGATCVELVTPSERSKHCSVWKPLLLDYSDAQDEESGGYINTAYGLRGKVVGPYMGQSTVFGARLGNIHCGQSEGNSEKQVKGGCVFDVPQIYPRLIYHGLATSNV